MAMEECPVSRLIIVVATGGHARVLDVVRGKIEAYAAKCGARVQYVTTSDVHGKYAICNLPQPDADRVLILDADIVERAMAPDIFDAHPTGTWMLDEAAYRGHSYKQHRSEIEQYAGRPPQSWSQNWWNPGVTITDAHTFALIFQMPPWDVSERLYTVGGGQKIVKNMPWINWRIAALSIPVQALDVRWHRFVNAQPDLDKAYFWHCAGCEQATDYTGSKIKIMRSVCARHNEPLDRLPYRVHFVNGRNGWILEKMQGHIERVLDANGIAHTCSARAVDKPGVINYYNPYRGYKAKSAHALDVAFCTHPEIPATWDMAVAECDLVVTMCRQYFESVKERNPRAVLIYPGVDEQYRSRPFRAFCPTRIDTNPGYVNRKGLDTIEALRACDWIDLVISNGKMSDRQMLCEYRQCDAVVSTANMEGGPMSLLEGGALGKPVYAREGVGFADDLNFVTTYRTDAELIDLLKAHHGRMTGRYTRTWDDYAADHWQVFESMTRYKARGGESGPKRVRMSPLRKKKRVGTSEGVGGSVQAHTHPTFFVPATNQKGEF